MQIIFDILLRMRRIQGELANLCNIQEEIRKLRTSVANLHHQVIAVKLGRKQDILDQRRDRRAIEGRLKNIVYNTEKIWRHPELHPEFPW